MKVHFADLLYQGAWLITNSSSALWNPSPYLLQGLFFHVLFPASDSSQKHKVGQSWEVQTCWDGDLCQAHSQDTLNATAQLSFPFSFTQGEICFMVWQLSQILSHFLTEISPNKILAHLVYPGACFLRTWTNIIPLPTLWGSQQCQLRRTQEKKQTRVV